MTKSNVAMSLGDFCFPIDPEYRGVAVDPAYDKIKSRVYRIMSEYGLETAGEIADLNLIQLIMMEGLGPKSIEFIEKRCDELGIFGWRQDNEQG